MPLELVRVFWENIGTHLLQWATTASITSTILIQCLNNKKFLESSPCFQNGLQVFHSIYLLVSFVAATLFLLFLLWYNCFLKLSSLFRFILYLMEAMNLIYSVLKGHLTDFFFSMSSMQVQMDSLWQHFWLHLEELIFSQSSMKYSN